MTRYDQTRRKLCLGFLGLAATAVPASAGPYLAYAQGLAAHPPKGSQYRPDLEAELVGLLNAYRAQQGKAPVAADAAFQEAARALGKAAAPRRWSDTKAARVARNCSETARRSAALGSGGE